MCGSTSTLTDRALVQATAEHPELDLVTTAAELADDYPVADAMTNMLDLLTEDYTEAGDLLGLTVMLFGSPDHTVEEIDVDRNLYSGYRLDPITGRPTGELQANVFTGLVAAAEVGVVDLGHLELLDPEAEQV